MKIKWSFKKLMRLFHITRPRVKGQALRQGCSNILKWRSNKMQREHIPDKAPTSPRSCCMKYPLHDAHKISEKQAFLVMILGPAY